MGGGRGEFEGERDAGGGDRGAGGAGKPLGRECAKGREVTIAAGFEKFATIEECFRRRDAILRHGAVYAEARACVADEERFVRAMARHWATDPEYAEKLLAVLREVKEARR